MSKDGGKIKLGIRVVLVLLFVTLACWFLLIKQKTQSLPARITLPDGTSARIMAVTCGTNHVVGTKLGEFAADHLPEMFQSALKSVLGRRAVPLQTLTTPTPELLVWLDRQTNRSGGTMPGVAYFKAFLGDGSNFMSGGEAFMNMSLPGISTEIIHFNVFPRRDRQITLNIFDYNSRGIGHLSGSLSFANPLFRKYPEWQPEHLPAKKRTGDVEVTLDRFETGYGNGSTTTYDSHGGYTVEYSAVESGGENASVVYLKLRPLMNTNEVWQVAGAELSDATGNNTHGSGMSSSGEGTTFAFTPALWPGEAAWKLRMEIKRAEGFRPEEIFVFKNVPLGELDRTNVIGWSTNVAGVTVTLRSIFRRAPMTNNAWSSSMMSDVHFIHSSLPEGTQMDLLRMICDTGKTNLPESWSSGGTERDYSYRAIPVDARTADFIFAIQQSRFVEFTVKPELPKEKKQKEGTDVQ
jgi:hypothetical protein